MTTRSPHPVARIAAATACLAVVALASCGHPSPVAPPRVITGDVIPALQIANETYWERVLPELAAPLP